MWLTLKPALPLSGPFSQLHSLTAPGSPHLLLFFRVDFFFFFLPLEEGGGVKSLSWEALREAKSGVLETFIPHHPAGAATAREGTCSLKDHGLMANP